MTKRMNSGYDPADDSEMQARIDLTRAVGQLSPRQQAIVALRSNGYTQQSITELLEISRTTVWADEKAALASISDYMGPDAIVGSGDDDHE